MPELPEVEAVRRHLEPAMRGERFDEVSLRRKNLRRPFPPHFADRLRGTTVRALNRRGKYLLADLSSDDTLLVHLGMSGWFRVEHQPTSPGSHDHVVFDMSSGAVVTFNDPRRFGVMDLIPTAGLERYGPFRTMGPEPLSPAFDGTALARACRGKRAAIKVVLLDQRTVAGVGNIYASEALHVARLSPKRQARSIATPTGLPRPTAHRLAAAIKTVLLEAIERVSRDGYGGSRFRVYDREGKRCRRSRCPGIIRRLTQGGRSTFYCPVCQR